jgi:hypothetical protein
VSQDRLYGTAADRRKGLADAPHDGTTGLRTTDRRGISTRRAGIAGVIQFVTPDGATDAVGLFLLGAYVANEVGVRYFATRGHLGFRDEETGVCAFDFVGRLALLADALEQAFEFIGGAVCPFGTVRALAQGGE